jgi:GNAT superfamily N-acetyltransferase
MISLELVDPSRTRSLRRRVLRPHLTPDDPLPGDDLVDAVHIGALDDWVVVGTCFVFPEPCPWRPERPAWHLRQMATAPDRRGEGIGAAVLNFACDYAHAAGARLIWCNARATAVGFYAGQGWQSQAERFMDAQHTEPHERMWRDLGVAGSGSHASAATGASGNRRREGDWNAGLG